MPPASGASSPRTTWPWKWKHNDLMKCQELLDNTVTSLRTTIQFEGHLPGPLGQSVPFLNLTACYWYFFHFQCSFCNKYNRVSESVCLMRYNVLRSILQPSRSMPYLSSCLLQWGNVWHFYYAYMWVMTRQPLTADTLQWKSQGLVLHPSCAQEVGINHKMISPTDLRGQHKRTQPAKGL